MSEIFSCWWSKVPNYFMIGINGPGWLRLAYIIIFFGNSPIKKYNKWKFDNFLYFLIGLLPKSYSHIILKNSALLSLSQYKTVPHERCEKFCKTLGREISLNIYYLYQYWCDTIFYRYGRNNYILMFMSIIDMVIEKCHGHIVIIKFLIYVPFLVN